MSDWLQKAAQCCVDDVHYVDQTIVVFFHTGKHTSILTQLITSNHILYNACLKDEQWFLFQCMHDVTCWYLDVAEYSRGEIATRVDDLDAFQLCSSVLVFVSFLTFAVNVPTVANRAVVLFMNLLSSFCFRMHRYAAPCTMSPPRFCVVHILFLLICGPSEFLSL